MRYLIIFLVTSALFFAQSCNNADSQSTRNEVSSESKNESSVENQAVEEDTIKDNNIDNSASQIQTEEVSNSIPVFKKFQQFEPYLRKDNDTTYIINFWATWCRPCVQEIPEFVAYQKQLDNQKIKLIFVSIDEESKNDVVQQFAEKQGMKNVVQLVDSEFNEWLPKVHQEFEGSIPSTLVYLKNKKVFHTGMMSLPELTKFVNSINSI
jgi:thiol-disulfide isomerase/thioredoxin